MKSKNPSLVGLAPWLFRVDKPNLMPLTMNGVMEVVYHSKPNDYLEVSGLLDYMYENQYYKKTPSCRMDRWHVGRIGIINIFRELGIQTIGEFRKFTEDDLWKAPRAGHSTVRGAVLALASLGIFLKGSSRWSTEVNETAEQHGFVFKEGE